VRSEIGAPKQLLLQTKEFIMETRSLFSSHVGQHEYKKRAGNEGTMLQGIRRGTVRRSRYKGLPKTYLQEVATAAGINILRSVNHLNQVPMVKTRISRFARLAH